MSKTRDELMEMFNKIHVEWLDEPKTEENTFYERLANAAETFYAVPTGLIEVRGYLKKHTVESGKELALTVTAINSIENKMALARINNGLTLRGIQLDIEAASESAESEPEDPAETEEENPDQLDIEDEEFSGSEETEDVLEEVAV